MQHAGASEVISSLLYRGEAEAERVSNVLAAATPVPAPAAADAAAPAPQQQSAEHASMAADLATWRAVTEALGKAYVEATT